MNDGTTLPVFPNTLGTENTDTNVEPTPQSLLDEKQFQNVLVTKDGEPDGIPLSTIINLKCKKRMLSFPMDFKELTIDGLIDTRAISNPIPEMDLRKIRLLSPQSVTREGPNGEFHEMFIIMVNLTGPIIGLLFLQRNHTVLDMRQAL